MNEPTVYFYEEQRFRQPWVWLLVLIPAAASVIALLAKPGPTSLVGFGLLILPLLILFLFGLWLFTMDLETTVRSDVIVVQFHELWPTRVIRYEDIARYEPRAYRPLIDYGGWGVRFGMAGMAFNVSGKAGVLFRFNDGGRLMVGSQRPGELAAAIGRAMASRRLGA